MRGRWSQRGSEGDEAGRGTDGPAVKILWELEEEKSVPSVRKIGAADQDV